MKLQFIIIGLTSAALIASSCTEKSVQQKNNKTEIKKLNESAIASGYDNIRVANEDIENNPDQKMMNYALKYKGEKSDNWQVADSASKQLINNYFRPNDKWKFNTLALTCSKII